MGSDINISRPVQAACQQGVRGQAGNWGTCLVIRKPASHFELAQFPPAFGTNRQRRLGPIA